MPIIQTFPCMHQLVINNATVPGGTGHLLMTVNLNSTEQQLAALMSNGSSKDVRRHSFARLRRAKLVFPPGCRWRRRCIRSLW